MDAFVQALALTWTVIALTSSIGALVMAAALTLQPAKEN